MCFNWAVGIPEDLLVWCSVTWWYLYKSWQIGPDLTSYFKLCLYFQHFKFSVMWKLVVPKTEFASWSDINLFCCKMIVFMALSEPETKTWTETIDNNMTTVGSINPSNIFRSYKLNLSKLCLCLTFTFVLSFCYESAFMLNLKFFLKT